MPNLRNVDFLVFVLVKVPLDKLLKVAEPHLPRLPLLDLHLVEAALAQPSPDVLLESVVEERASAEPTSADGRLLDAEWFQRYYLVSDQTVRSTCQLRVLSCHERHPAMIVPR